MSLVLVLAVILGVTLGLNSGLNLGVSTIKASPLGPDPLLSFEGQIDYQSNADTLLRCDQLACGGGAGYDCTPLDQSTVQIQGIPDEPELRILHARISWAASGGANEPPDQEVTLQTPNGTQLSVTADSTISESFQDGLPATDCQLIPFLCATAPPNAACDLSFYANHVDLTEELSTYLEGGGSLNGDWGISDISISGSQSDDPATVVASIASLTIGAWSLIIIYEAPSLSPRKIYYYQGFELNEGVSRQLFPQGFVAPADPTLDLSLMILEGDLDISGDQLLINGRQVSDACNPVNNIFNSTVNTNGECRRGVTGVDLDRFQVSGAINEGDEEARLELVIPAGNGFTTQGEQLFTHWMILAFDHLLPDFDSLKPEKRASPPHESVVSPNHVITYDILIKNQGQAAATSVSVIDPIPAGVSYEPNSITLDGQPIPDGPNQSSPLESGLTLTGLPQIGDSIEVNEVHTVSFQVRVLNTANEGDIIENIATIDADLIDPISTNAIQHTVGPVDPNGGTEAQAGQEGGMSSNTGGASSGGDEPVGGDERGGEAAGAQGAGAEGGSSNVGELGGEGGDGGGISEPSDQCGAGTRYDVRTGTCESICGTGLRWDSTCDPGKCVQESEPSCDGTDEPSSQSAVDGCQASSWSHSSHLSSLSSSSIFLLMLLSLIYLRRDHPTIDK